MILKAKETLNGSWVAEIGNKRVPFEAHFPNEKTETHMYDAFCLWSQGEQTMEQAGPSAESPAALTNPHLGISPLLVTLAKEQ